MVSILTLLAFSSLAIAESPVLTVPFFSAQSAPLVASVISVQPGSTTIEFGCDKSTTTSECNFGRNNTLTYGPSIYRMSEPGLSMTVIINCILVPNTATCDAIQYDNKSHEIGSIRSIFAESGIYGSTYIPVTVTKGAEKLPSVSDTASKGSAASAGSGVSQTGASATASNTSGSQSASKSGSAAPENSTNAAAARDIVLKRYFAGVAGGLLGGLLW